MQMTHTARKAVFSVFCEAVYIFNTTPKLTSGSFSKVSCSYGSLQPYQCTFCVVTASNVNGLFMHAQYHRWVIWKMLGPLSYMDPSVVDTF